MRRNVYRFGMQQVDTDVVWYEVWERYLRASGTEKDNLAYCLAQTRKQWLIKRLVKRMLRNKQYFKLRIKLLMLRGYVLDREN